MSAETLIIEQEQQDCSAVRGRRWIGVGIRYLHYIPRATPNSVRGDLLPDSYRGDRRAS